MTNCEFCNQPLNNEACYGIGEVVFHSVCFRNAVKTLANSQKNQLKNSVKLIPESPTEYMVIMNPDETLKSAPREHYKSYKQAAAVAKRLTIETGKSFWVMKHIASTEI